MRKARNSLIGLSAAALVMIATFEGYRGNSYDDGVGVQTIGFGTTQGVKPGSKTDPVRAMGMLLRDATAITEEIARCIGDVPLYQHEADAFVSMAYNLGATAICTSSIPKLLNQDPPDYLGACKKILEFNKAKMLVKEVKIIDGQEVVTWVRKKVPIPGLTKRRQQEYEMCMTDKLEIAGNE
ncbi:glycoside hydrolase family protein [Nitrosomonas communis]|uniref:glycoside hydrolase family protein n=1 Tax=Nitrosomonas communis TaxID=44574 RepID=UPI003D2D6C37